MSASKFHSYDKGGPFGDPDGSREDFQRFISFDAGKAWGGLAIQRGDLTVRVVVGGKGSGKTMYKRLLEDGASANSDVYVFRHAHHLPPTNLIERFSTAATPPEGSENVDPTSVVSYSQMFDDNLRTGHWQILWRRAIFRSLASLFYASSLCPKELTPHTTNPTNFFNRFSRLVPRHFETPESIFNQVSDIISRYGSPRKAIDYLNDPLWESFEATILRDLHLNRPVCYFIDAIDEDFRHAPSAWIDCQKGLFYTVMGLLRDTEIDSGLHICICIRDIVYSSVLQSSEHSSRYYNVAPIRLLEWSRESASVFLKEKLKSLPPAYMMEPNARDKAKAWLGFHTIRNVRRKIDENVLDYILRHTRFLPRDIVNMGNALCLKVIEAKTRQRTLTEEEVRNTVATVAELIGNETLRICGNHLAVSSLPRFGLKKLYEKTPDQPIESDWATEIITQMLWDIGKDIFTEEELHQALEKYQDEFAVGAEKTKYRQYRIETILWQHGLLGYKERIRSEKSVFYSSAFTNFFLPPGKPRYVLHSSLIDAIKIRSVGKMPVAA